MHDNGSAGTTTYLVHTERQQGADILVELPGAASAEGRAEARQIAIQRIGAGEAIAWAAVGDPIVFAAEPVPVDAVA